MVLVKSKGCVLCLDWPGDHRRDNCSSRIGLELYMNCRVLVNGVECGLRQNQMLYGSTAKICNVMARIRSMPPISSSNYSVPSNEELEQADKLQNSSLPMQKIMVEGQNMARVTFFNSGSNTNLIHRAFAESLGLPRSPVSQHLGVTG